MVNRRRIRIGRRKINLGTVFAGQNVGIKEVSEKVRLVSFMQYDLGCFDHETDRVTSAENPFGAKVLAVSMGQRNTSANLSPRGDRHETRTAPDLHNRSVL
jgi:hypothetical protein